jgi:DNA-binding winged helix-turn-helix (wHTH) protein
VPLGYEFLKVLVELTDVGRVVARFNALYYAFGAEEVELNKVDKRINKVRKALEESKDLSDKSQIREYG